MDRYGIIDEDDFNSYYNVLDQFKELTKRMSKHNAQTVLDAIGQLEHTEDHIIAAAQEQQREDEEAEERDYQRELEHQRIESLLVRA